ncbi:hypothetical protein TNCV_5092431 [Trichonephila clavipes]|nr:hypothetical protein TNCV_5092431 [Trichonephila clavipes]
MDCLKFKLEIVEALSASPPTIKGILTDDEDNSVVIPLSERSKRYNSPDIHVMTFIMAIPGSSALRAIILQMGYLGRDKERGGGEKFVCQKIFMWPNIVIHKNEIRETCNLDNEDVAPCDFISIPHSTLGAPVKAVKICTCTQHVCPDHKGELQLAS